MPGSDAHSCSCRIQIFRANTPLFLTQPSEENKAVNGAWRAVPSPLHLLLYLPCLLNPFQMLAKRTELRGELAFPSLVTAPRSCLPRAIWSGDRQGCGWTEKRRRLLRRKRKTRERESCSLQRDLLYLDMKLRYRLLPSSLHSKHPLQTTREVLLIQK
jgi:hypothetical protein